MNFRFRKPKPAEASAEDLLALASLTEQMELAADILRAHQDAMSEAVMALSPGMVAAFDDWERAVTVWNETAARLNLKERHAITEAVNLFRPSIETYRNLIEQAAANVEWPETIEEKERV